MPLLKKGVLLPEKGVDWSVPSTFIDDRAGFPKNMTFDTSQMKKRPGKSLYGATAIAGATPIMGLGVLELTQGTKYLIRASKTKLEKYNTTISDWQSIATTDFTAGDDDFFHFANVAESNLITLTNGYDKIRKWTGSGNNAVLGGNPPLAKYLCYSTPYLLLGHVTSGSNIYPWKVQWCDTDNPEAWTGGNSGSRLLSKDSSELRNIVNLNEYVAAYKEKSVWLGRKVETSDIFQFDCMVTGVGLASPRAVSDVEGVHYFMGLNDFYVFNGIRVEPIGKPVRDRVFSTINRLNIKRCFAIHVQNLWEVWFFILSIGQTYPTEVWKYNYRTGFWYYDTCSNITAAVTWKRVDTQAWDDDTPGSWDEAADHWDAGDVAQEWEEVVFGNSAGYAAKLDYSTPNDLGIAVEGVFETKDFVGDVLERYKRWLQLDMWVHGTYGAKLYVDYSIDSGNLWTNIPYSSSVAYYTLTEVNNKFRTYFDIKSEKIRFRFRNAESGEVFYIRNFYPYYLVTEEAR